MHSSQNLSWHPIPCFPDDATQVHKGKVGPLHPVAPASYYNLSESPKSTWVGRNGMWGPAGIHVVDLECTNTCCASCKGPLEMLRLLLLVLW
jgi:hypothetical protein